MKKVIVKMMGGLGNQLFCYAAARRLAWYNHAELVLDHVTGFVRDFQYQRSYQLDHFNIPCRQASAWERLEPLSRERRFLKRKWNQRYLFDDRHYLVQEGMDFDARWLERKVVRTLYIEGYWQSERYFQDIGSIIRADFKIKEPTDEVNVAFARAIRHKTAVSVHVRFFDEPHQIEQHNLLLDYYARAMTWMEQHVPHAHYFVFSDNPERAKQKMLIEASRVTYLSHNQGDAYAYADLWLMTQCKHFIIANSTFSWWGAWLATYPDKKVIAPGLQLNAEKTAWGFTGLIPTDWICL